jgi:hypothetical protein
MMRPLTIGILATAALGIAIGTSATTPATAQAARPQAAMDLGARTNVIDVQWRRHHGWHGRRYYGHRHGGGAAALGLGLAAGIIGAGIAASAAPPPAYGYGPPPGDPVAYCMQRFRSYDPNSGTYLGYDGLRHPCP